MDETLKALRTTHAALLLVAGVVVVICVTTFQTDRYTRARDELLALSRVSWESYGEFANQQLAARIRGKVIDEVWADYRKVFADVHHLKLADRFSSSLLPLVPIPDPHATVGEYRKLLSETTTIGYYRPSKASVIASIVSGDFKRPQNDLKGFTRNVLLHRIDFELFTKSHDIRTLKLPSEDTIIIRELNQNQLDGVHNLMYTTPTSNTLQNRIAVGKAELISLNGNFIQDWLKSRSSPLIRDERLSQNTKRIGLPESAPLRDQLDVMTIDEAIAHLDVYIKEKQQTFSILGQTFASGLCALVAPSVSLALLFLLLVYQRQLMARAPGKEDKLADFPWLGLFNDRLSRAVFEISVGFVPVLSVLLCLVFLVDPESRLFAYNLTIGVLVLIVALFVLWENRELLRRLNSVSST